MSRAIQESCDERLWLQSRLDVDHFAADAIAAAFVDRFCCGYRPPEAVAGALGPERR